jgi:hypothetical protein
LTDAADTGQAGTARDVAKHTGIVRNDAEVTAEIRELRAEIFGSAHYRPGAMPAVSGGAPNLPWPHAERFGFVLDPITDVDIPSGPPPPAPLHTANAPKRADYFPDAVPTPWSDVPPIQWDRCSKQFREFAQQVGPERAQAAYIAECKGIYDAGAVCHVELPESCPVALLPMMDTYKCKPPTVDYPEGRDKGRACVMGNLEHVDRDYTKFEAPAPVATHMSQRMQDIISVKEQWPLRVVDCKLAFLGGLLFRLVLCRPLAGIELGVGPNGRPIVWLLLRACYGLVESSQLWYVSFATWLLSQGYRRSPTDMACFVHATSTDYRSINIHVDDSKLCFQDPEQERLFIAALLDGPAKHGGIHDLGHDFGECVGVEYHVTPHGYVLKLTRWIHKVADKLALAGCKARDVPLPDRLQPRLDTPEAQPLTSSEATKYNTHVGILQWAASTGVHPNICFAASHLGTRRANPVRYDYELSLRAIRFLVAHADDGIHLERSPSLQTDFESEWCCDSDWAGCKDTFRSHGGHCGFWGGLPMVATARRHKSMSRSSTQAEIIEMSNAATSIAVHRRAAGFMRHPPQSPATLHADNAAGIAVAEQQIMLTAIARHIAVRYLYIRELVGHRVITLAWVSSARNLADIFTKPLLRVSFHAIEPVLRGRDRLWRFF